MSFRLNMLIAAGIVLTGSILYAEIPEKRKFQLDSITTNIDKSISADLVKVHAYLHNLGINDEERVWMFYGFIATHIRYDKKRKNDQKAPVYLPEYTVQKRSGVCRDFAKLFSSLCEKSNIPCLEINGKADSPLLLRFYRLIHLQSNKMNHAWNVVKIDGEWKLMDVTWTSIIQTHRFPIFDEKSKATKSVKVKLPDRKYYNPDPVFMMDSHVPIHPAFLLSSSVPTYKTARKKASRHKLFHPSLNFSAQLDSIYQSEFKVFSSIYMNGCKKYSRLYDLDYRYQFELSFPYQKLSRTQKPDIKRVDEELANAKKLTEHLNTHLHIDYSEILAQYEKDLAKKREKLMKEE